MKSVSKVNIIEKESCCAKADKTIAQCCAKNTKVVMGCHD